MNAPTLCIFSHLNHSLTTGLAPSVPPSRVLGVEASSSSVRHRSTGVRWTCGAMSLWASWTEARVRGRPEKESIFLLLLV